MKTTTLIWHLVVFFCALAFCHAQTPPGSVLWSYNAPGTVTGSPVLAPDGTIYLGTASALCAITNAGSNKWTFPAGQSHLCTPTLDREGTVYFGDNAANVYALRPDKTVKWAASLQAGNPGNVTYESSPALDTNGCLYISAAGSNGFTYLYAISSNGGIKWTFLMETLIGAGTISAVIGADGTIYAGLDGPGKLYALNPDGSQKWSFDTPHRCGDSAAVGSDGSIYFTAGWLYALSADGTQKWVNQAKDYTGSSPVIGKDDRIYVASLDDFSLNAFSPAGQSLWSAGYASGLYGYPTTTPAIDDSGMIYYSASNSVFAISPQGNIQWMFASPYALVQPPPPAGPTTISPSVGPDGTIYAAFGSTLYAIKGGTNGLATSPWPMYRQNLRHTGKVEKPSLSPPKKRADANFDFQLAGEVGQPYTVQGTSNFLNWTSITSFVATALPMPVSDLTATNAPARFYRASSP